MPAHSKWLHWTPETPSLGTDKTDKSPSGGSGGSLTQHIEPELEAGRKDAITDKAAAPTVKDVKVESHLHNIREQFEERAAIAEHDGGLSRIDAELSAWDQVRTCIHCGHETEGEEDAVRVARGGWLHLDGCYNRYFNFPARVSRGS